MSSFDVHSDEMHSHPVLDDDAIEATLAGRVPAHRPDLTLVAAFATEVRTAFEEGPAPRVGDALARLFDTGLAPAAADAPTIATVSDRPGEDPARRRRRSRMVATVFGTIIGKVAIAGVAAASVVGGMGAMGALPDPAQSVVSRLAGMAGIELPSGHEDERVPAKTSDEGTDHTGRPTSQSGVAGTGDDGSGTDSRQGEADDGDVHQRDDGVNNGDSEADDTSVPAPSSGAGGPSNSDTSESDDFDASDPKPSSGSSDTGSPGSGSSDDSSSSGSESSDASSSPTSGAGHPEAPQSGSSDTGPAVAGEDPSSDPSAEH